MYAFDRHEVGLPGMPKKGLPETRGEDGRLARLDGDAVKDDLTACGNEVDDQIAFADRASAGEDDEIGGARRRRGPPSAPAACRGTGSMRFGRAAVRGDTAASVKRFTSKIWPVASASPGSTISLPVENRIATRAAYTRDVRAPDGGEGADAARIQQIAGANDAVAGRDVGRRVDRCF